MRNLNATLRFRFKIHIGGHIGQKQASYTIPCPRLHPPRRNDEEEGSFHAPASSCIWYNHHRHVYREAKSNDYLVYASSKSQETEGKWTNAG